MAQQHPMSTMTAMGGPVGGAPVGQPANANTPAAYMTPEAIKRKLDTAIYEYMICNNHYDIARSILKAMHVDTTDAIKQSPNQRQTNGIDGAMDVDNKENLAMKNRPDDLPAPASMFPSSEDHPFLQDWWFQFWDLWKAQRQGASNKQNHVAYIVNQRAAQKARQQMVIGMDPSAMTNGITRQFANPLNPTDLRLQAIRQQGMNKPANMAQGRPNMSNPNQGNQMQASQMERQGSNMNMSDARNSGSPNNGDNAPSPKRLRTEGSMQQLNQARPGQPGQNSQGMPPNPAAMGGPAGAQQNAMNQQGVESPDYYAGNRIMPNGNGAIGQPAQQQNGNHALQDYQMQLMLLEQQNKKRLLMARQEQDTMTPPGGGPGPNAGGMIDPGANPGIRGIMAPNGMRPPGTHPMEMQIMRQNGGPMMANGGWQPGQPGGPPQGQMMQGQQPGQPPNMALRQGAMPPPPAPAVNAAATQPSSPAQPPAPPTPGQGKKNAAKKEAKGNKAAGNKKVPNNTVNDGAEAPPTPTPPPPVTPNHAASFNQKNGTMQNGQSAAPTPQIQNINNGQLANMQAAQDMSMPFDDGQFSNMDFAALEGGGGDVLDSFDFDSFLNTEDTNGFGFDANLAFGDGSIEADLS